MAGDDDSRDGEPPWHERTSTVAGVSAGALAVIAILWFAISYATGGSDDPPPQYYVQPSESGSTTTTTTATSTETITSTSPPMTSDINPGAPTGTTTTGTTGTGTTGTTDTTTSFNPSNLPHTKTPSTYDDGRTRPRFNQTRTVNPRP